MKASLKSLLADASNGFATLPYLTVYREELEDSEIEVADEHIMTCLYSFKSRRLMLFNPINESTLKKSLFKTLNRKGFEAHKDTIWEVLNNYQNSKPSRYIDKERKKVTLTKQDFEDIVKKQFDEVEKFTLYQLYDFERRIKDMRIICEQYGLNYEQFKKEREEAKSKI